MRLLIFYFFILFSMPAFAAVLENVSGPGALSSAPAAKDERKGEAKSGQRDSRIKDDAPVCDPGGAVIVWDGKKWDVGNQRVFGARFEKYLNIPEETSEEDWQYNGIVEKILHLLAPERASRKNFNEACQLLEKAAEFQRDARICESIAYQVVLVEDFQRALKRFDAENQKLKEECKRLEHNAEVVAHARNMALNPFPIQKANTNGDTNTLMKWKSAEELKADEIQILAERLMEIRSMIRVNKLKREIFIINSQIEFQTLIVQLFMQRRFHHVLIAARFYRNIFTEGEAQLHLGGQMWNLFSKATGMPPTMITIEMMANEIINDVTEGINSFNYLLEKNELDSASKLLSETYLTGEYMPEVRTLARDKKRQVLSFSQKTARLASSIEVKNFDTAQQLVDDLQLTGKDFDNSKPLASIKVAMILSDMHLAKAKNAAILGDKETLKIEIDKAMEIWPGNPALKEIIGLPEKH